MKNCISAILREMDSFGICPIRSSYSFYHAYDTDNGNERLLRIEKSLHYILKNVIVYEGCLIISPQATHFKDPALRFPAVLPERDSNIYVGIGRQRIRSGISTSLIITPIQPTKWTKTSHSRICWITTSWASIRYCGGCKEGIHLSGVL